VIRITSLAFASLLLAVSRPALAIVDAENRLPPDRAPSLMTPTEIRAYNEGLDLKHPYYIRCKKDPVVGSLARKLRVCRTNEEWKQFAAQGQNNGREVLDEMSHAPINQGAPDACSINRC
jgi:hypothetical protein